MKTTVLLTLVLLLVVSTSALAADTVVLWFAGANEALIDGVQQTLLPRWREQNPEINLEIDFIPWGELSPKLATSFAGGMAPDIFMHGQAATAGFAEAGQIIALDQFLETWSDPERADYGQTLNAGLYEGQRYMMPVQGSGNLLVYRTDFFEEVGLDPASPPQTWEELEDYARKLAKKDGSHFTREGIGLPTREVAAQTTFGTFLWQNGGSFVNESGTEATFHQPEGIEALEFLIGMIRDEEIGMVRDAEPIGDLNPLAAGNVAMSFMGAEALTSMRRYAPDVYENIAVAPPLERVESAAWYSFAGFFITKQSRNPDLAWQVVEFFHEPEALELLVQAYGGLPPRISLANADFIKEDANLVTFVDSMAYARTNPNIPTWVRVRDIIIRYIEQAAHGRLSPEDALNRAAEEVNDIL